ncbi:VanZ family protein [Clostridium sp. Marseille-P2415]|uniref:VanZ family protein n=1 Tax=Clostridium sp. Marseille-P2415 TaxID=1805471 RepID=UPI000988951E|nr:VanZ family protein [Clostridium sp. Marseille-P2415]
MNNKKITYLWYVYLLLLFIVIVIKFNGSINELFDRMNSINTNKSKGNWNVNLVPFNSIEVQLEYRYQWWAVKSILGNLIAFIPLGFLLPITHKKCNNFFKTFLVSLMLILAIEVFQLITSLGYFDVDDIIMNMIGSIIGFCLYSVLKKVYKGKNGF